ncbi:hypothetical protein QQ056_07355 [Oscillatoria laete-virens NRMC-F 0139]|nr:hypothetical protein [Oscillatoria laete-virens]MDL5053360.1 hypothetical protein [Oscillatoria laete-virens NRMC-F 0139]
MRTFKDTASRSWSLQINVDAIKRVRGLLQVDLLDIADGKLIEQLASDPILLCDVIFAVIKPDADATGVTDMDFGRAMGGDCLEAATTAFLEELADFFPSSKRQILRMALSKLREVDARVLALAEKKLNGPALNARIDQLLESSGEPSMNSPESLGVHPVS